MRACHPWIDRVRLSAAWRLGYLTNWFGCEDGDTKSDVIRESPANQRGFLFLGSLLIEQAVGQTLLVGSSRSISGFSCKTAFKSEL